VKTLNIFNKITLKSLKQNRTRTVVTVIGVILSVAMITGVTTFISSLQNFLVRSEMATSGNWHLRYENMMLSEVEEIKAHSEVASVYVVETVGHGLINADSDAEYVFGVPFWVEGFSVEALENVPIRLLSGRMPQNYTEIVIPHHLLRDDLWADLGLGDVVTLDMESGFAASLEDRAAFDEYGEMIIPSLNPDLSRTYTIVGISAWHAHLNGNTLITAASENIMVHTVYIRLINPRNVFTFDETAGFNGGQDRHQIHMRFNVWLLRALGVSTGNMSEAMMIVIYSMGAILIALIMLGSVSLIYNSFAISVSERAKQFGILSSVGATGKQIRKSVLFEGVFVGILGIPLGLLAGIGGIGIALLVAQDLLSDMLATGAVNLTLSISVGAIIVAVLVGILTIFISALIPAQKAAKPSAIEIIRQSDDIKINTKSMKTSRLTHFLFGLEGDLAAKNFRRNKKRYRATVVSLVISVVLFISANAFGMYLALSGERVFIVSEYDVAVFFPTDSITVEEVSELYSHIHDADYVTASNVFFRKFFSAWADTDLLSEEWLDDRFRWGDRDDPIPEEDEIFPQVMFINDELYREFLRESGFTGDDSSFPAVAQMRHFDGQTNRFVTYDIFSNTSSISLPLYAQRDWERTGNSISITVTPVNVPPALTLLGGSGITIIAPYSEMPRFDFEEYVGFDGVIAFMSDNPSETTAHIEELIESLGFESEHIVVNAFAGEEENRRIIFLINFFIYGFVTLISLITIANVFNTVSTSINLRRREFAMLRSIGMTERGFSRMMNFECLFYGLKALLLGLPLSFGFIYLIYLAVISGIDAPFVLPWSGIGLAVFSVFFVVFVTMLYSVRKLRKANVIDVLRADMA